MEKNLYKIGNEKKIIVLKIIPNNYTPPSYQIIVDGETDSNGNYIIENTLEILVTRETYELIRSFGITNINEFKKHVKENKNLKIFLKIQWKKFIGVLSSNSQERVNYTYENIEDINSYNNNYMNFVIENILVGDYNEYFQNSKKVWHIYLRKSEKNSESLRNSLKSIVNKAKVNRASIGSILIHNGISARKGKNLNRRDFNYFISNILKNFTNYQNSIHVISVDRLSRGKREAEKLMEELSSHNIPIYFDSNRNSMEIEDSEYILSLLTKAEEYSDTFSIKAKLAKKRKAEGPWESFSGLTVKEKNSEYDCENDSDDNIEDSDDNIEDSDNNSNESFEVINNNKSINIDYSNQRNLKKMKITIERNITIEGKSYKIEKVPGDGNCMLYAVLLSLKNNYSVKEIRELIATYMLDNRHEFIQYYVPNSNHNSFEEYVELIRDPNKNEWCDHLCLKAIQYVLDRPIYVFQDNNGHLSQTNHVSIDNDNTPIYIYYNSTNHYDALIEISNNENQSMIGKFINYFSAKN